VGIKSRLEEKQAEIREMEQEISELEDRLEDLRRSAPAESQTEADDAAETDSRTGSLQSEQASEVENEALWRKRFAAIDYKMRIAQTELDILQRELNLGSVQYYPNPATAMKESITRRVINEHRKAIEDNKTLIADLNKRRAELEDELQHAGGPAGWARE
jgi:chromosome segregation ATPase